VGCFFDLYKVICQLKLLDFAIYLWYNISYIYDMLT